MNLSSTASRRTFTHGQPESDGPIVLVAEDDPEMRQLIADALTEDGCRVRSASDGKELLAMLTGVARREMPMPSLIVMDVRMPRCSGMDVLTALRLAEWEVPVIMITGFGDAPLHERAGALGAALVLDKPFDLDVLRDRVRDYCLLPPAQDGDDDGDDRESTLGSAGNVRPIEGGRA